MSADRKMKSSELADFSPHYNLFLKPMARVSLTVQIPTLHDASGQSKSFTTWEIIEKLRQLCPIVLSPPTPIKVVRTTLEFVRFVAEVGSKADVKRVVTSLDSQYVKLSGFPQNLRVRASEAQPDCPRRHDWEAFFRDAENVDETKPGERPDTLTVSGLPVRWFAQPTRSKISSSSDKSSSTCVRVDRPNIAVLQQAFEVFGKIRRIDVPMLDPAQNPSFLDEYVNELDDSSMLSNARYSPLVTSGENSVKAKEEIGGFGKIGPDTISVVSKDSQLLGEVSENVLTSALGPLDLDSRATANSSGSLNPLTFIAYIQYVDYTGFTRAMDGLRGQKLVYSPLQQSAENSYLEHPDDRLYFTAEIKVDFDRTQHLSERSIKARECERNRLVFAARRRRAEAKAAAEAEVEQRRLIEDAKRKSEERKRAEALAIEAEKMAKRAARAERKKQLAIERCKREKEILFKQKIILDERRRLLAVRKVEAIRLVTFLLRRVQARHDAVVAARRRARMLKAEQAATQAEAVAALATATVVMAAAAPAAHPVVEEPLSSRPSSSTVERPVKCKLSPSESCATQDLLFRQILHRREERLRQILLKKRTGNVPSPTRSGHRPSSSGTRDHDYRWSIDCSDHRRK
ncbi:unnamed protein product [Calicophoron daubneyi]|uniref:A-kinase anchor protein 17A n=1 Tax=Calicophoron daubneyi TaxID=300641 RepID=A0AAV2TDV9_CALDB